MLWGLAGRGLSRCRVGLSLGLFWAVDGFDLVRGGKAEGFRGGGCGWIGGKGIGTGKVRGTDTWLRCGGGRKQRTCISRRGGDLGATLSICVGGMGQPCWGGGFWFADRRAKEVPEEWIIEGNE